MKPKFPTYYYVILFFLFVLGSFSAYVLWSLVIDFNGANGFWVRTLSLERKNTNYWHQEYLPTEIGVIIPVDASKIIEDPNQPRQILSNIVNIALKNEKISIAQLASDLKDAYPTADYKIVYIDSVINRLQVQLPQSERDHFKTAVKDKLPDYSLLVWDEAIFKYNARFNDPYLQKQESAWYLTSINSNLAWESSTGNSKTIIAVIDNGFDLNHPELVGKSNRPYNVIDHSSNVSPSKVNHGTHVASTIVAAANNGAGLAGMCPDCTFMPIKIEDNSGTISSSYVIDAILYAIKNKAAVINLSLGLQIPVNHVPSTDKQREIINSFAKDEETFWDDLFNYANDRNVTCVLAAGNSSMLTGVDPFQRSDKSIKVGAVDSNRSIASFSNYGDKTTIYAPGVHIFGAAPGDAFEYLDGTSMAAPIVAGYVGLLKTKYPKITHSEILKKLKANTTVVNGNDILYFKKPF